jgi:hypothetical protein
MKNWSDRFVHNWTYGAGGRIPTVDEDTFIEERTWCERPDER